MQFLVRVGERGQSHGQLVGVGADGFKIVLVGEVGIGGAGEAAPSVSRHGIDHILLPQKAVAAAGAEVADAQTRNAAKALHFFPEPGLGARVEDVQFELAEMLESGAGFELADGWRGRRSPTSWFRSRDRGREGELAVCRRRARNRRGGSRWSSHSRKAGSKMPRWP